MIISKHTKLGHGRLKVETFYIDGVNSTRARYQEVYSQAAIHGRIEALEPQDFTGGKGSVKAGFKPGESIRIISHKVVANDPIRRNSNLARGAKI